MYYLPKGKHITRVMTVECLLRWRNKDLKEQAWTSPYHLLQILIIALPRAQYTYFWCATLSKSPYHLIIPLPVSGPCSWHQSALQIRLLSPCDFSSEQSLQFLIVYSQEPADFRTLGSSSSLTSFHCAFFWFLFWFYLSLLHLPSPSLIHIVISTFSIRDRDKKARKTD